MIILPNRVNRCLIITLQFVKYLLQIPSSAGATLSPHSAILSLLLVSKMKNIFHLFK